MEQIQQHEWEYKGSSEKITTYHCKRCPCVKMEFHNRWHTVTYNDGKGNKVSEEPACITRYPEQTERRSNCPACSMLEQGVKFRISPPHTCGKKNWQGGR